MLEGLNRVSQQVGLKMNMDKTKLMPKVHVTPTPVMVENSVLEVVDAYVDLGQTVQLGRSNFGKKSISKSSSDAQRLGRSVTSVRPKYLSALRQRSEAWCFTKSLMNRLRIIQRAMERATFRVSLRHRIRNEEIETTDRKAERWTSSNEMDVRLNQGRGFTVDAGRLGPKRLEVDEGDLCPVVDLTWLKW
nr:uncharacterized protein LOC116765979 [Danaus plexippus plexippus]